MIRVLIADDEELFREGLAMDVDWDECGLELAGMACDGNEALDMVSELRPDIVVTDIRMPYLDGLEFITKAMELSPDIQFIIVSGHEEFEYAQRAVRLGVCDFLLKPLDDGELQNLLLERKAQILKDRTQQRERDVRDSFLRLNRSEKSEESYFHCIIVIQYDDYSSIEGTPEEFYSIIRNCVLSHPDAAILESRNGTAVVCLSAAKESALRLSTGQFTTLVRRDRSLSGSYSYTLGVGMIKQGTEYLNDSCEEAKSALNQKFLEGRNKAYYFEKLKTSPDGREAFPIRSLDYSELLQALINGNREKMDGCLDELIRTTALMGKDSFAYGLMVTGNLFTEALKILDESGGNSVDILGNPMGIYEKITSKQTMEEMFQELRSRFETIRKHLSLKSAGGNEALYQKIRSWMSRQYIHPGLNLQRAADEFHISQGHLCSVFSSCSDETFTEYLTTLRINKACDLMLSSDFMVYEIAYKVGFNNPTYFSSVFKRKTGVSPGQYKKNRKKLL